MAESIETGGNRAVLFASPPNLPNKNNSTPNSSSEISVKQEPFESEVVCIHKHCVSQSVIGASNIVEVGIENKLENLQECQDFENSADSRNNISVIPDKMQMKNKLGEIDQQLRKRIKIEPDENCHDLYALVSENRTNEPLGSEVASIQKCCVSQSAISASNIVETELKSNDAANSKLIKKESIESKMENLLECQDFENSADSQNNISVPDKIEIKRKPDEIAQQLRKKIKVEPDDNCHNLSAMVSENRAVGVSPMRNNESRSLSNDSNNHPFVLIENAQLKQEPVYKDELSQDLGAKTTNCNEKKPLEDDDIIVLPVLNVEKSIPVITISDSDERQISELSGVIPASEMDNDQKASLTNLSWTSNANCVDSSNIPSSENNDNENLSPSPEKNDKEIFSADILEYFNVVSELDRYDCKESLEYLSKYKCKTLLQKFFPIEKSKAKSTCEIIKEDILFKKITETENASTSPEVDCSTSSQFITEPTTKHTSLSTRSIFDSASLLPRYTQMVESPLSNFEVNRPPPNSWISNLNLKEKRPLVTLEHLQEMVRDCNLMDRSKGNNKVVAEDHDYQRPSLQDSRYSSASGCIQVLKNAVLLSQPFFLPCYFPRVHTSSSSANRDPRAAANKMAFQPRNGESKFLLLYQNIGKDDVTEYFEKIILQWNPKWLKVQEEFPSIYPPICDSYSCVRYYYPDETAYYNTYVRLHLLHIWQNIFDCYKQTKGLVIKCKFRSVEKSNEFYKISCTTELNVREVWPKRDDIAWCKYNQDDAFLRVGDVERKSTQSEAIKKLRIHLYSLHDFHFQPENEFSFYIIFNVRIERIKVEALKSVHESLKRLILTPKCFASNIEYVRLSPVKNMKLQRDDVLKIAKLVTVIETFDNCNTVSFITLLTYVIVFKTETCRDQARVLICLKDENAFHELVRRLIPYNPVLAVRNNQISLCNDHRKYTLEERLDRKEKLSDIMTNCHILITVFSAFDYDFLKTNLSKVSRLFCIIDDAHLCTEAETALPLALKLSKLLLLGKNARQILSEVLCFYRYDVSLFERLLSAKTRL